MGRPRSFKMVFLLKTAPWEDLATGFLFVFLRLFCSKRCFPNGRSYRPCSGLILTSTLTLGWYLHAVGVVSYCAWLAVAAVADGGNSACFKNIPGCCQGAYFKTKTVFANYRDSHYKDKRVIQLFYLCTGNYYTGKVASLYWNRPQCTANH